MHKLEILDPNIDIKSLEYFMEDHSDFIMTQASAFNDLGSCVICLHEPHIVCKIMKFRLDKADGAREFRDWQSQRIQADEYAREATKRELTVKQYVESVLGKTYDQEFDEPRLIAKVPGLNVFLELYGVLFGVSNLSQYQSDHPGIDVHKFMADVKQDMQDASVWYRLQKKMHDVRHYGSTTEDRQLLNSWVEQLDDQEFFKRSKKIGIGFDNIDESRRGPVAPRHKFNDEELAEYKRLKEKYYPAKSFAEINKMAVDNIAARKKRSI